MSQGIKGGAERPRRPSIVVLEGPDGAGKTTLADQLIARSPEFTYYHEGPPPTSIDAVEHYLALLARIVDAGKPAIIDRFALGERVYGPVLRGVDRVGSEGYHRVYDKLADVDALTVICLPPPQVALANWRRKVEQRREMITNPTTYLKTYAEFAYLLTVSDLIPYDYTIGSVVDVEALL